MTKKFFIEVILEDGPEGYLRVHSEQLPGLILSGQDRMGVVKCILPAMVRLLELQGYKGVKITQTMPFGLVLTQPSPRKVDIGVDCTQENRQLYVVELPVAA